LRHIKPASTAEHFIANNLGIEALAALRFKHGIGIDGVCTPARPGTFRPSYRCNTTATPPAGFRRLLARA
jgi:hypothetical protein